MKQAGRVILAGERGAEKVPGFDRGNSPREFAPSNSKGCTLVLSTTTIAVIELVKLTLFVPARASAYVG